MKQTNEIGFNTQYYDQWIVLWHNGLVQSLNFLSDVPLLVMKFNFHWTPTTSK